MNFDYVCGCDTDGDGVINEYGADIVCYDSYDCLEISSNTYITTITCEDMDGIYYEPDSDCESSEDDSEDDAFTGLIYAPEDSPGLLASLWNWFISFLGVKE